MRKSKFFAIAISSCLATVVFGLVAGIDLIQTDLVHAQDTACIETGSEGTRIQSAQKIGDRLQEGLDECVPNSVAPEESQSQLQKYQSSWQLPPTTVAPLQLRPTTVDPLQLPPTTVDPLQLPPTTVDPLQRTSFILYGDTNRDGFLDNQDYIGRDRWSWSEGALMLFNNDDDDSKGSPDWQDEQVNGESDLSDLAQVHLHVPEELVGGETPPLKLFLTADPTARPHINVFQRTQQGWLPVDVTGSKPLIFSRNTVLGVEAKQFASGNWNGLVTLQASAKKNDWDLASDTIQMRVSPWLMLPNTAPVAELYVGDFGTANYEFVSGLMQSVESTGAKVKAVAESTPWMQDTMEIGYVQWVNQSGLRTFNVVLNGNRGWDEDYYAQSLLSPDFGWFQVGFPRSLDPENQWADWYGNLEVTPPMPGYPLGRIYYGKAGDTTLNPEVVDFLKAQEIQGPPVDIDTSWLWIRHVDEIVSFIPTAWGSYQMLIVSPEEGVNLLTELYRQGHGSERINRGLSTEITVEEALKDNKLISENLKLQREKINPIVAKLKQEFKLTDDQIIRIPAMFSDGVAWWPNMVNSVVVNGKLLVSNPQGAIVYGKDYMQEAFSERVAASGLKVNFLNDIEYQELKGNTHCATNTRRLGIKTPFWQVLPDRRRFSF